MTRCRVVVTVAATLAAVVATPTLAAGARVPTGVERGTVALEAVVQVDTATAMAARADDATLYVAEQEGRVVAVRDGSIVGATLDLRDRVTAGGEQGLLGLAFSPDGTLLYVHFTNRDGNARVEEYEFDDGVADPGSRRVILRVRDEESNHNGGQLAFGPDGMLYVALGDGGGGGDEGSGHAPGGNGQSLRTLLGKILRIDPTPDGDRPYTIPPDNPFADGGGRPEIWSYGLRNPWRFSFDRATGDLWVGDVGESTWEEIDVATAADGGGRGVNFGWNLFEGRDEFREPREGESVEDLHEPLVQLASEDGNCSVIAGFVYRGTAIPDLEGAFVFSDYCNGEIRWLRQEDGEVAARGRLGISADSIASFGEDADGELYVISQSDGLFRLVPR